MSGPPSIPSPDGAPASATAPALRRALAVVLGTSLALKLAVLALVGDVAPVLDETQYLHAARSIAAGAGVEYTYDRWDPLHQGPLYPWFLALVFRLGGGVLATKVLQVLLSTLTVATVFELGKRTYGARAGLAAAAALAFYPTLIAFTHYNWSETFYLFWFTLGFLALFRGDGGLARPRQLLLAGALLGLAALARTVIAYTIPPLLVAFFLLREDGVRTRIGVAARRGVALGIGFLLPIVPQSVSIYREYGELALIGASSGRMWHEVYNGYAPRNSDHGFPQRLRAGDAPVRPPVDEPNPVLRARAETRAGLRFLAENPGLCFRRFWIREAYLLNPTSFLVRHVRRGYYDERADGTTTPPFPRAVREAVVVLTVGSYLALALAALAGFFALPRGKDGVPHALLLGSLLWLLVLHGLTFGMSRYRLILLPLLAVAAGYALAHPREVASRLREPRRAVPCTLVVLLLVWAWSLYWKRIWITPT